MDKRQKQTTNASKDNLKWESGKESRERREKVRN